MCVYNAQSLYDRRLRVVGQLIDGTIDELIAEDEIQPLLWTVAAYKTAFP